MSESFWEQTGPGSACRCCVCCQLIFIPLSFFHLFPFKTPIPSCFLKIHSLATQLFGHGLMLHALSESVTVMSSVMLLIHSGVNRSERSKLSVPACEKDWSRSRGAAVTTFTVCETGFYLLSFEAEDYFLLLLSYLFLVFSGAVFFFVLLFLWGVTSCIVF